MNISECETQIKEAIELAIVDFMNDLPKLVSHILDGLTLDLLGLRVDSFSKRKNALEIDPFSKHGLVIHAIGYIAKIHAHEKATAFDTAEFHDSAKRKYIGIIRGSYEVYYANYMSSRSLWQATLTKYLDSTGIHRSVLSSLNGSVMVNGVNIGPTNMEASDPNSFDGLIGQFMLKSLAEDMVSKHE